MCFLPCVRLGRSVRVSHNLMLGLFFLHHWHSGCRAPIYYMDGWDDVVGGVCSMCRSRPWVFTAHWHVSALAPPCVMALNAVGQIFISFLLVIM